MIPVEKARDLLATQEAVLFALLFGSFAKGEPQPWSDVDIGVYLSRPWSLLEIGKLNAALERVLGREVDLSVLNIALERNPALAYKVVAEGTLLFCRDPAAFADFKTRVVLKYLDTAFLRAMITGAFQERLDTGRFGQGE
ncbi:MAG: type VII toxin-antitoxin system MntA family adenylyltransferase antitoxin [Roseiflexus sp.]